MKKAEVKKLKAKDFVNHKKYGLCLVDRIIIDYCNNDLFGLAIRPLSVKGFMILANNSGCLFNRILEDKYRNIIEKVENPIIPKLIIKNNNSFEIHEWVELGEVSNSGLFASKKITEFSNENEAINYLEIENVLKCAK